MNKILIFAFGAAIGSVVTWKLLKTKYELIAQEEIDSVKEVYSRKKNNYDGPEDADEASEINECENISSQEGYINYSEISNNETESFLDDKPYVIPPDEFGAYDNYEQISLTYYADRVLADNMDELVEDVDETVGIESLSHFGDYEDDSVFVRNDRLKADFEILLDERNFSDVIRKNGPRHMED